MIEVGSYARDLRAPLARLIENALDWEHLPHVHQSTFGSIVLVNADDTGWTAIAGDGMGDQLEVDLRLDADRLGWVTVSSRAGAIVGRIESRAHSTGPDSCHVAVRFLVPDAPAGSREAIGAFYQLLYARLYDEDEELMIARTEAIARGPSALRERRTARLADGHDVMVPRYCPHQGLPIDGEPDEHGILTCPWHGYRFDVRSGRCVSGQSCSWS